MKAIFIPKQYFKDDTRPIVDIPLEKYDNIYKMVLSSPELTHQESKTLVTRGMMKENVMSYLI
jgi:hypothetical protein